MKRKEAIVIVWLLLALNNKVKGTWSQFYHLRGRLIFQEEFDFLNTSRWQHIITAWRGGNNEFEYYTDRPENSYVRDGVLHIRPTLTADRFGQDFLYNGTLDLWPEGCNVNYNGGCVATSEEDIINPIQSARMRTINSFSFTYGTVEIRAKMPRGDWIWPAMWMMPTENLFGPWPRSGEIDIVEIRANNDFRCGNKQMGNTIMGSTLHFGTDSKHNIWRPTHYEAVLEEGDFASDFHIFGLQRLPQSIRFYVDGILIGEITPPDGGFWEVGQLYRDPGGPNIWGNGTTMTPFDYPFHFILNVAVGGNFFPDGCINRPFPKPWSTRTKQQMLPFWEKRHEWLPTWNLHRGDDPTNALQVDYIRVYEYDPYDTIDWYWYQRSLANNLIVDSERSHVYP
ncbi:hypothetical protein OUZ56_002493 [Daphnia magna]|uniref:GH16 domain-containing protein n=2 Tax=Daphnia magna TaxID=35525 RepID=A0ABR0A5W1_9CRUS|nr:hypothetical protein OUZ56_002493 [Daphnia magna]